jgi:type IV secretion system protein VirD4
MKVNFIIDEFGALGHLQVIDDCLALGRGYGLGLQMFIQSLGQLKGCFPKDGGQTALANTAQIFFSTAEFDTAEKISKRLGNATILVDSWGSSRGYSLQEGMQRSESRSRNKDTKTQQQKRALLEPDEVLALDPRQAITFCPGSCRRPMLTKLVRYYEQRLRPPGRFREKFKALRVFVSSAVMLAAIVFAGLLVIEVLKKGENHGGRSGGQAVWPAGKVDGRNGGGSPGIQGRSKGVR